MWKNWPIARKHLSVEGSYGSAHTLVCELVLPTKWVSHDGKIYLSSCVSTLLWKMVPVRHTGNTVTKKSAGYTWKFTELHGAQYSCDWISVVLKSWLINSMEQNITWEANSHSAGQEFPAFYGTWRFLTTFLRAHR
jgi:hypothetical protein